MTVLYNAMERDSRTRYHPSPLRRTCCLLDCKCEAKLRRANAVYSYTGDTGSVWTRCAARELEWEATLSVTFGHIIWVVEVVKAVADKQIR